MQLAHIPLDQLSISTANMRFSKKPPDLADLLPSVRLRGVLVPLIVRAEARDGGYEIVAGRRRFLAACEASADGTVGDLPCAIMEAGDDAAALEASILENVARDQPHEVEQWTSFTRLVREGRSAEDIGLVFALTQRQVAQVLALGNLLPKIRDLYRADEIDAGSIRLLTMASKAQQKDWLALFASAERYAPTGQSLKSWLFGGASIPTANALFDLARYPGAIITDLFGEGGYFADADAFFVAQRSAIEERRAAYREAGWADAVLVEPGHYFNGWEHERTPKSRGGKVFITLSARGEVAFHEGFLTRKEADRARRQAAGETETRPARAELTGTLQTYLDLHMHAAVRAHLLGAPALALRLLAAHAIAGSSFVTIRPDPQRAGSDAIAESIETCIAETRFDEERRALLAMLGLDPETSTLIQSGYGGEHSIPALLARLIPLGDGEVMRVLALVMGEALQVGSEAVAAAAIASGLDMAVWWQADEAFIDLLRDREVLAGMVAEVAGEEVASANRVEPVKTLKAILRDALAGTNGRAKAISWLPRWLRRDPSHYTERGGSAHVRNHVDAAMMLVGEQGAATDEPTDASDETAGIAEAA